VAAAKEAAEMVGGALEEEMVGVARVEE